MFIQFQTETEDSTVGKLKSYNQQPGQSWFLIKQDKSEKEKRENTFALL